MLRRLVLPILFAVLALLAAVFAMVKRTDVSLISGVVSALATVAALGLAIHAALPHRMAARSVRVAKTGAASAHGMGSIANSGLTTGLSQSGSMEVGETGSATASQGGRSNTGVQRS